MNSVPRCVARLHGRHALRLFIAIAAASAVLIWATAAHAQDTLVYSFEPDLEGFGPNGAGITVTQDTIGATEGTNSMKVAMTGPTFVGALTGNLHPDIGDPPGLDHVTFDMTLTDPFPEGGFAVVGVMIFGDGRKMARPFSCKPVQATILSWNSTSTAWHPARTATFALT